MKEATGELNMTVITVVAIAAVAAFFYAFVWPAIKRTIETNTICANGPGTTFTDKNGGSVTCGALTGDSYTCTDSENNNYTCNVRND